MPEQDKPLTATKDGHSYTLTINNDGSSVKLEDRREGINGNYSALEISVAGDVITFTPSRQYQNTRSVEPTSPVTSPEAAKLLREKFQQMKSGQELLPELAQRGAALGIKVQGMAADGFDEAELQVIRDYRIKTDTPQR